MRLTKQYGVLLRMSLMGVTARLGLVLTIVIGVTCAVGVLVSMLAMGVGARREALGNVRPDRVVVYSSDAQNTQQSSLAKDVAAQIPYLPGIRRNASGKPIVVFLVGAFVQARYKSGREGGFLVLGVTPGLTDYRPELHMTAGRLFTPGLHELIASNKCATQFENFRAGDRKHVRGSDWAVVGNFDNGTAVGLCTVYADAETVLSTFARNTYNEADVMLESAGQFAAFVDAVKANPALHLKAEHEADIVAENMQQLNGILNFVSFFVGTIIALAATIGAANSLYAIVDSRRRELATLRALGFGAVPIIAAILSESIVLALPGAVIGALVSWALFNGLSASPLNSSFHLAVTPALALLGVGWALAIGAIGGFLPALRAARVPVTAALRAT
ncbi:MAG TPA: ABC transporter permease [Steroidobacteraceae bacterium]|nr:ABC transporter permease [Steroidobacteraceae bacterium]